MSALADTRLRLAVICFSFEAYHRRMVRVLNQSVDKYCESVIISLFIVDVDINQLFLCTGGHTVFLRAALLVAVIKDVLDYKLLQHRNNCLLFLGILHLSKGSLKKPAMNHGSMLCDCLLRKMDINHAGHKKIFDRTVELYIACCLFCKLSKSTY